MTDKEPQGALLAGKVAIVTGGAAGIGEGTAHILARKGARVMVADLDGARAESVAAAIRADGHQAVAAAGDVSREADVVAIVAKTIAAFGRIDILHNNAALTQASHIAADGEVTTIDVDHWDRTMAVNLRGPMLCCKHVIPHMKAAGGGSIVNMGSDMAVQGGFSQTAYGTSKGGMISFTRYVATQYGKFSIRANILLVGIILKGDDLLGKVSPARQAQLDLYIAHHLTTRLGGPPDIGEMVAFLSSDHAAYITAAEIAIDGGFASHQPMMADIARMRAAKQ